MHTKWYRFANTKCNLCLSQLSATTKMDIAKCHSQCSFHKTHHLWTYASCSVYNKIKPKLINNSIASAMKCGLNILEKLEAKLESLLFFFSFYYPCKVVLFIKFFLIIFIFSFPILWLSTYTSLSIQIYCKSVSSTFTQTS